MSKKSYLLLNKIFAGMILAIFLYAAFYSPDGNAYPIPCVHEELLGARCPTCGMSHAFSSIVRFQFSKAIGFQPNSISVFGFFLMQLILRIAGIVVLSKNKIPISSIINIDVVVSLVVFLIFFRNLIFATFYILYKMLLTGIG
jgi:hypothetical protein